MRFLILLCLAGCIEEIDQRWELDHDHVVAVRATPPRVMPGERAAIDALIARADGPTRVTQPAALVAQAPEGDPLYGIAGCVFGSCYVEAPSEETLAIVRARDGLAADAPVPVSLAMAFPHGDDGVLYAKKTVYLGARAENPAEPIMAIDGQPAATEAITLPMEQDVYVSVPVEPGTRVNWLTSCGSLFQDDVATAFLRVSPEDTDGELAVVLRDAQGGVAWRVWPVSAAR